MSRFIQKIKPGQYRTEKNPDGSFWLVEHAGKAGLSAAFPSSYYYSEWVVTEVCESEKINLPEKFRTKHDAVVWVARKARRSAPKEMQS